MSITTKPSARVLTRTLTRASARTSARVLTRTLTRTSARASARASARVLTRTLTKTLTRTLTRASIALASLILASCGGSNSTNDPTDTAAYEWSQWSPASNSDTSVIMITQMRQGTCKITVNGNPDNPPPTCTGSNTETRTIANPSATTTDPADTATWNWSNWTPANNADTSIITITQMRSGTCKVTVNGTADNPPPTCTGSSTETRTITNPLSTEADTAIWSAWSQWASPDISDTVFITILQVRTRMCLVTVKGANTDIPPPTCAGNNSETRTIPNPLSAAHCGLDCMDASKYR